MISIKKAKIKDVEEVAVLSEKFFNYHHKLRHGGIEPWKQTVSNRKYLCKNWAKMVIRSRNETLFIALDNGKIVGYVLGVLEQRPPVFKIKKVGNIYNLFVLDKYRRQRIGKRLLQYILKWFKSKKVKYAKIDVDWKNELGKKVWEKYGFKKYNLSMMKKI